VELHNKYKSNGFDIWLFPSNQLLGQEKRPESEIKEWAQTTYKVEFPMFSKVDLNGPSAHPLYKFMRSQMLKDEKSGKVGLVSWNFDKFVLDGEGKTVGYY